MTRSQRIALIEHDLQIGPEDSHGWRPIKRAGVELGLLRQTGDRWRVEWKLQGGDPWGLTAAEYGPVPESGEPQPPEKAEAWAVREVANGLAMKEEKEAEGR